MHPTVPVGFMWMMIALAFTVGALAALAMNADARQRLREALDILEDAFSEPPIGSTSIVTGDVRDAASDLLARSGR